MKKLLIIALATLTACQPVSNWKYREIEQVDQVRKFMELKGETFTVQLECGRPSVRIITPDSVGAGLGLKARFGTNRVNDLPGKRIHIDTLQLEHPNWFVTNINYYDKLVLQFSYIDGTVVSEALDISGFTEANKCI